MKKESAFEATGRRNIFREQVRENFTGRTVLGQPRKHVYDLGKRRGIQNHLKLGTTIFLGC